MVTLNMIDTIGSGIKKMFVIQKNKYFPLPDYDTDNNKVKVKITGKILDINYARKLAQLNNLSLKEIILLDKIAKGKTVADSDIKKLKAQKLIEGRKPNYYIASKVAKATGEQADYIKNKGFDDEYYEKLIITYLTEFGYAKSKDLKELLHNKFSDILSEKQKAEKLRNMLQKLKRNNVIYCTYNRLWKLV